MSENGLLEVGIKVRLYQRLKVVAIEGHSIGRYLEVTCLIIVNPVKYEQ